MKHFNFDWLIKPLSFEQFVTENWEKHPFHHKGSIENFEGLLSLSDIDLRKVFPVATSSVVKLIEQKLEVISSN